MLRTRRHWGHIRDEDAVMVRPADRKLTALLDQMNYSIYTGDAIVCRSCGFGGKLVKFTSITIQALAEHQTIHVNINDFN